MRRSVGARRSDLGRACLDCDSAVGSAGRASHLVDGDASDLRVSVQTFAMEDMPTQKGFAFSITPNTREDVSRQRADDAREERGVAERRATRHPHTPPRA